MAAALALDRPSALAALRATARTRADLNHRLAVMGQEPSGALLDGIALTETGRRHAAGMVAALQRAIAEVDG